MTVKKTGRLVASTGVALALGASLLAATPAVAAQPTHSPAAAAASAGAAEAAGPTYADRNVSITTSVIEGDDIVVRGSVTYRTQPTLVRAAAGSGFEAPVPVAADGSFEVRIPRHGLPEHGYVLEFGKPFGSTGVFARLKDLDTYWYADNA
jgi:hypothetical protein